MARCLGDIEAAVALEAPCVQADSQVVGEEIIAGEIEIDQPGKLVADEKYIVGKQIRMAYA